MIRPTRVRDQAAFAGSVHINHVNITIERIGDRAAIR